MGLDLKMGSDFERAIDRGGDKVVGQRARHMGRETKSSCRDEWNYNG